MSEKQVKENVSVTITVSGYVPGMENDPEFLGCAFRRTLPGINSDMVGERNSARTALSGDKCKLYGVKPLGATSAPASGPNKTDQKLIKALAELTDNVDKIIQVMAKKTGKHFSVAEVQAILAG